MSAPVRVPAKVVLYVDLMDPVTSADVQLFSELGLMTDADEVIAIPAGSEIPAPRGGTGSLARFMLLQAAIDTCTRHAAHVRPPPPGSWRCTSADAVRASVKDALARHGACSFVLAVPASGEGHWAADPVRAEILELVGRRRVRVGPPSDGAAPALLYSQPEAPGWTERCPGDGWPVAVPGVELVGSTVDAAAVRSALDAGAAGLLALPAPVAGACKRYGFYGATGTGASRWWTSGAGGEGAGLTQEAVDRACAVLVASESGRAGGQEEANAGTGPAGPARAHGRSDPAPAPAPSASGVSGAAVAATARPGRRVAVLGGSFDPITHAHLLVAGGVVACGGVDEVWVVPCGRRPDKPSLRTAVDDRLASCFAAIEASFPSDVPVFAMPLELAVPKALAGFELLHTLGRLEPVTAFELIVGADLVPTLPSWRHAAMLQRHCSFLAVGRPGYDRGDALPEGWSVRSPPAHGLAMHLSSSTVRARLQKAAASGDAALREAALALVPAPTAAAILRGGLYAEG